MYTCRTPRFVLSNFRICSCRHCISSIFISCERLICLLLQPFTGEYVDNHETGIYTCACCDAPLFRWAIISQVVDCWWLQSGSCRRSKQFHRVLALGSVRSQCNALIGWQSSTEAVLWMWSLKLAMFVWFP